MGTRGAQQALVPGRVVVLHDSRTGLSELGVVCGTPPAGGASGGSGISGGPPRQRTAAELLAPASAEPASAAGGLLSSELQECWLKLWHTLWQAGTVQSSHQVGSAAELLALAVAPGTQILLTTLQSRLCARAKCEQQAECLQKSLLGPLGPAAWLVTGPCRPPAGSDEHLSSRPVVLASWASTLILIFAAPAKMISLLLHL